VIRVYDDAGDVIETHEHAGEFKEWWVRSVVIAYNTLLIVHFHKCNSGGAIHTADNGGVVAR